ncbi:fimbrial protein [Lelliottia sp. SL45]|jgi:type 1 fimbria pilin|uniref:fimbrial protein n=1 Tax=Lelliottia TaxID=1330545 RepID=UPI000FB7C417|nr:fimbrial protein [Lelliottia sp. SL45]MCY1697934.1 fimbrial protein [Lelliottia sp. SL45]
MKFVKLAVPALIVAGMFNSAAMASDGTINFTGDIVNAPCVVSTGTQNQNVNLGQVKSSVFAKAKDSSTYKDFKIILEECTTTTLKNTNITFRGSSDEVNKDLLSIGGESGAAKGVGIEISDATSATVIPLNKASSDYALKDGQNTLMFKARYVATAVPVVSGHANSQAEFQLAYK